MILRLTHFEFSQNFWICFMERLLVSGWALNESSMLSQHFRSAICLCWDCEFRRCRISITSLYLVNNENKTAFSSSVKRSDFLSSILECRSRVLFICTHNKLFPSLFKMEDYSKKNIKWKKKAKASFAFLEIQRSLWNFVFYYFTQPANKIIVMIFWKEC